MRQDAPRRRAAVPRPARAARRRSSGIADLPAPDVLAAGGELVPAVRLAGHRPRDLFGYGRHHSVLASRRRRRLRREDAASPSRWRDHRPFASLGSATARRPLHLRASGGRPGLRVATGSPGFAASTDTTRPQAWHPRRPPRGRGATPKRRLSHFGLAIDPPATPTSLRRAQPAHHRADTITATQASSITVRPMLSQPLTTVAGSAIHPAELAGDLVVAGRRAWSWRRTASAASVTGA